MSRIKYDMNLMKYMQLFENLTRARLKDCIEDEDKLIFVVEENEIGRAIGKNGSNVRRIEGLLKRSVKIVEFSPDPKQFVRNFLMPISVGDVREENGVLTIVGNDTKTRGMLIGRERKNIDYLKNIVGRYFHMEDIKVV